jgi:hypothetical protein
LPLAGQDKLRNDESEITKLSKTLEQVRALVARGDVRRASQLANRVYRLTPVEA